MATPFALFSLLQEGRIYTSSNAEESLIMWSSLLLNVGGDKITPWCGVFDVRSLVRAVSSYQ
jgi:hypothetical protein